MNEQQVIESIRKIITLNKIDSRPKKPKCLVAACLALPVAAVTLLLLHMLLH